MVVAKDIAMAPGKIGVPAIAACTLILDNRDAGVPHSIEVKDGFGATIVMSEIVTGPARVEIPMPALPPGDYPFTCTVHPNMVGVIIAQP